MKHSTDELQDKCFPMRFYDDAEAAPKADRRSIIELFAGIPRVLPHCILEFRMKA
jgi:hypothetical protein